MQVGPQSHPGLRDGTSSRCHTGAELKDLFTVLPYQLVEFLASRDSAGPGVMDQAVKSPHPSASLPRLMGYRALLDRGFLICYSLSFYVKPVLGRSGSCQLSCHHLTDP